MDLKESTKTVIRRSLNNNANSLVRQIYLETNKDALVMRFVPNEDYAKIIKEISKVINDI